MRPNAVFALAVLLIGSVATAELPRERPGRVEVLAEPPSPHWVWVTNVVFRRIALVDLDQRRVLGQLSAGYGAFEPVFSPTRPEIYLPETYYSRGSRGERTDVVTIYDSRTLQVEGEVEIPAKRALSALTVASAAISDDARFLAVFNLTPATSLSIVDLEGRAFVEEISTPGCSLVYAAGRRRFLMLCMDGSALSVTLDEKGHEARKERSEPFFDPSVDPVTEKAVRYRDQWLFVSFQGKVHPVDVSGATLRFGEPWPLFDEAERRDSWRIGGTQHLAIHEPTGRLYSLVHQGEVDTHKEDGSEVWVYDLATRERIQRIVLLNPGPTFLGEPLTFGKRWLWPFNRLSGWMLRLLPASVGQVQVTRDEQPLLITAAAYTSSLGIYDALNGEFRGRVHAGGLTTHGLRAPWSAR